jgi:DNA-binding PadR family transcriptional regulator
MKISGTAAEDGGDILLDRAAQFRAAPRFPEAMQTFTESMAKFRLSKPKRINKLLGRDARFRTVCFTLYLHFESQERGADAGASYTRVLELVTSTMGVGHRVVDATLDMMSSTGLVVIERGKIDRRLKLYRPTEAFYELLRGWLEGCFIPLDFIEPEGRRMARLRESDDIARQFITGLGRSFREGELLNLRMPHFSCFFNREGGWPFLAIAMSEAFAGRPLPSRSEIAHRYGISKSQIAVVATEAAQFGLLTIDPDGARVTAKLLADYEYWVSVCLAIFASITTPSLEMASVSRNSPKPSRLDLQLRG